jgi:hypothetical protein
MHDGGQGIDPGPVSAGEADHGGRFADRVDEADQHARRLVDRRVGGRCRSDPIDPQTVGLRHERRRRRRRLEHHELVGTEPERRTTRRCGEETGPAMSSPTTSQASLRSCSRSAMRRFVLDSYVVGDDAGRTLGGEQ